MDNYSSQNNSSNPIPLQKENIVLKFVILGDSNVGKTSILHHFIFNKCKKSVNIFLNYIFQI